MTLDIAIYGIIDPQVARGRDMAAMARTAALAGATLLQYRAKTAAIREMIAEAAAIHQVLRGTGVPLLINDRVDVALAVGCEGVHIGAQDMPIEMARRVLGRKAIIGATIKSSADIAALEPGLASYICIGGVYPTQHKDNPDSPVGIDGFKRMCAEAKARFGRDYPVGAIAGITANNLAPLIAAGCDGVAVIGAMFGSDDIASATHRLKESFVAAKGAGG